MTGVLLLDVMDTLVRDPIHEEIPAFFGMSLEELFEATRRDAWIRFELGELDEEAYLRALFEDERPFDHAGLLRTVREAYRYLEGIEPLLAELRARGVSMHALSNYPCWYRMIEERLELSRYLEWSFVSCRTGRRKPSPEAYLGAAAALGVAPEACVFVDDREGNVRGARAIGMRGVLFRDAEQLRAELEALG